MEIDITGHHIEVTPSLKLYVTEKLQKLAHHFEHITKVHVILSVEKLDQKAEAIVNSSGLQIFAESTNKDMYASIDDMLDKLDRQIVKHKEKLKNHKGNGHHHNNDDGAN